MGEVEAEEVFAFVEEKEGKLLDVSFVDDKQKNAIKCVFSDIFGDAVVEQCSEDQRKSEVEEEVTGKLVEEEIEVIGVEPEPVWISAQHESIRIIIFLIKTFSHTVVESVDGVA